MDNIILLTDSYKTSHYKQYPPKTQTVYSYFEARSGAKYPYVVFYGLQYYLKRYLAGQVVTEHKINKAKKFIDQHMGEGLFNEEGWRHILDVHNGNLPVEICAVDEGKKSNISEPLITIQNTDPKCYWLTNYLETLLVQVWYPTTVATISNYVKSIILKSLEETGDPTLIDFKLHDFGFRGVSSVESAGLGGSAHLINFKGTDTMEAINFIQEWYGTDEMPGFSIPASEHSTITSWGQENEIKAFENMINSYPFGPVACVSDSYDIYRACSDYWGTQLKDKIISRDGFLVVRPDSGDPEEVVVKCLSILADKFGAPVNNKGFRVLDPHVRLIQGDGCTPDSIEKILLKMKTKRFSADNVAFGMGGGLLQKLDRDTQRFAFKCSAIEIDGNWRDVYKSPVTDSTKNSKSGRFSGLKTVFKNGMVWQPVDFSEVRNGTENE
jgi:nicotinamide phosphoribosyltransferase